MTTRSQADTHRRNIADLSRLATNDLRLIVAKYSDGEKARDALIIAIPKLVDLYGSAAATLAADWYDDLRDEAGTRGRFTAITATLPGTERTDVLARWGIGPMFSATPDKIQAVRNLGGGLQQIIADASRQTVTASAVEDPKATGWERSTDDCCDYCETFAGIVFTDEPEFEAHTNCRCVAVPLFG